MIRDACSLATLLLALTALPAPAQTIPVLREDAGGTDLWSADPIGGSAAVSLTGISLSPLALVGVPRMDRLLAGVPHGVPGAVPRISLPGGGSLFAFRSAGNSGLLRIHADGTPEVLVEVDEAGAGPALLPEIAVRDDGGAALLATTSTAGGGLAGQVLWVDLAGPTGSVALSATGGLLVAGTSLRLAGDHAWFVADGAVHHAEVSQGGPAGELALLLSPGEIVLTETAICADGTALAVVTEAPNLDRNIHLFGSDGSATLMTPLPGAYDTPHYDSPTGPWLALSPQGDALAFRETIAAKRELFVCPAAGAPPLHVTADGTFTDTIDNVGIIGFVAGAVLTFAAGEIMPADPGGPIDGADVFQVQLGASPSIQNISQTSGIASPPFLFGGDLELIDVCKDPLGERLLLVVDPQGADSALLATATDGTTGLQALFPALEQPPGLHAASDRVLVTSHPDGAAFTTLHLLHPASTPNPLQQLAVVPLGVTLDRFACDGIDTAAFVAAAAPGLQLPVFVDLPTGALAAAFPLWVEVSSTLAFGPGGQLVLGLGGAGGPFLFAALTGPGQGTKLAVPVGDGFPLAF